METLDQFVTDNGIERVDFIEVDVEGYEPLVLAGATDTIRLFRPVLYLEMTNDWFDKTGHSNESVLRFLSEQHDYRFFRMNGSEEEEITSEEDVNAYPQFDMVAYPG